MNHDMDSIRTFFFAMEFELVDEYEHLPQVNGHVIENVGATCPPSLSFTTTTMLARAPLSLRSQVTRLRVTSPARYAHGHGEYHHLPFAFPGKKRAAFAIKLSLFLLSGFSIPFAAVTYQLKKAGAA
ncbi:hypothetical protein J3R82DRAFT_4410 [Butyriboletus roseoflavus]|nr:hypothetical protein J3R82DRAFT_4410 [Butyriboletus roseoflavus]